MTARIPDVSTWRPIVFPPAGALAVPRLVTAGTIPEDELVERVLARCKSEGTREAYERNLRYCRSWLRKTYGFGLYVAEDVHLTAWKNHCEGVLEYKAATTRQKLSTLRTLYSYAQDAGIFPRNPAALVDLPDGCYETGFSQLTLEDAQAMVKYAFHSGDPRLYMVIAVLLTTGLRVSELCRARVEGLQKVGPKYFLRVKRKGGRWERVELPSTTVGVVNRYLGGRKTGPLVLSDKGVAIARQAVWQMVRDLGDWSLPHLPGVVHPHDCRHLFVSLVQMICNNLPETQNRSGHVDVNTTLTYVHALTMADSPTLDTLEQKVGLAA